MYTYRAELGLGTGQGPTSGETIRISAYAYVPVLSCPELGPALSCPVILSCLPLSYCDLMMLTWQGDAGIV